MERKKALFEKPAKKNKRKSLKTSLKKKRINKNMRLLVTMVH